MKHIENYESFNESWFGDKLKKWFSKDEETKTYNEAVSHLFERIKEIFDFRNIEIRNLSNEYRILKRYIYDLEETDSDLGYIKIKIDKEIYAEKYTYKIYIDDENIICSESILKNMCNFFDRKLEDKEKIDKNVEKTDKIKKALSFKNKYNI